jgi:hypothetical protein
MELTLFTVGWLLVALVWWCSRPSTSARCMYSPAEERPEIPPSAGEPLSFNPDRRVEEIRDVAERIACVANRRQRGVITQQQMLKELRIATNRLIVLSVCEAESTSEPIQRQAA